MHHQQIQRKSGSEKWTRCEPRIVVVGSTHIPNDLRSDETTYALDDMIPGVTSQVGYVVVADQ